MLVDAIRFWPLQLPMLLGCIPGMTKRGANKNKHNKAVSDFPAPLSPSAF